MTIFYLIRHGRRDPGPGDPPLNTEGRAMAQRTASCLAVRPVRRVYSSPLLRARETAAPIARAHGLEVTIDPRLRERANWGDLPGQSFAEFIAMWEQCDRDRAFVPALGDSAQAAGKRIEDFTRYIYAQPAQTEIVAAAHGGVISDFLINVFPMEALDALFTGFRVRLSDSIQECSITVVVLDEQGYHLEQLASVDHLL